MKSWQGLRIVLAASIFCAATFVLFKIILFPSSGDRVLHKFTFPATIVLPKWQFVSSHDLERPNLTNTQYISGKHYRYVQSNLPINIEIRYIINTSGDVKQLLQKYTPIRLASDRPLPMIQRLGVGFYSRFTYQEREYLSACINSRGGSTVTERQFRYNRNLYDVPNRLLLWLLDRVELRDDRCLWTQISLPSGNLATEKTDKILETAWIPWYQWWSQNFPEE